MISNADWEYCLQKYGGLSLYSTTRQPAAHADCANCWWVNVYRRARCSFNHRTPDPFEQPVIPNPGLSNVIPATGQDFDRLLEPIQVATATLIRDSAN
ncbi:uncharacterized protein N7479_004877 [Penicillium vulpinum]|uniref:uncharacterized protein n=1 Tax=Penicillium vulpinum TaxID=29845 RepID=UPI0025498411|nr:uncharacterized protein N7479_004877 [Penicillium vulpinum]KAJ5965001.1 hypothetical protein N7479_004877 [Penicillium vulpinum]